MPVAPLGPQAGLEGEAALIALITMLRCINRVGLGFMSRRNGTDRGALIIGVGFGLVGGTGGWSWFGAGF